MYVHELAGMPSHSITLSHTGPLGPVGLFVRSAEARSVAARNTAKSFDQKIIVLICSNQHMPFVS